MPEGDALHRAARRLQVLVGERLEVEAPHPRARVTRVAERLDGRKLLGVEAVGKNLLLRFEDGLVLRSHLRMTSRWQVLPRNGARRGSSSEVRIRRPSSGTGRCSSSTRAVSAASGPTSSPIRLTSTRWLPSS